MDLVHSIAVDSAHHALRSAWRTSGLAGCAGCTATRADDCGRRCNFQRRPASDSLMALCHRTRNHWLHDCRNAATSMSGQVGSHISLFVVGVVSVIAASAFLGWLLTRTGTLPGTTAVWGLSPGAATAMTLMAESFGADVELVALMQYLRVVLVAAVSSLILRVWGGATVHHAIASADWFPAIRWLPFAETTGLVLAGVTLARRLALPAGALFIPLVGEIILVHHGFMTIELPRWLLVIAYAVFGWRIGLRITPPLLAHAAKVLPRVLLSTVALICAVWCIRCRTRMDGGSRSAHRLSGHQPWRSGHHSDHRGF